MHSGILLLVCSLMVVAYGNNIQVPPGFVPLPPLPGNYGASSTKKTKPTQKPPMTVPTKQPPKPTTTKQAPQPKITPKTSSNCGLTLTVPNSNCAGGNSAVQQRLDQLKQELDRTRNQHQAQNFALQSMIGTLQNQQSGYITQITDLQNEVKNLVVAFNAISSKVGRSTPRPLPTTLSSTVFPTSVPVTSGPSNLGNVQQAVQNVRDDMRMAVSDVNNKLFNLTLQLQNNLNQESQTHMGIENQILGQATQIGMVSQHVSDLELQLQKLQQTGTGNTSPATGATSTDIQKLEQKLQKVERDLQVYDTNQQQQYQNIQAKANQLTSTVANHSAEIGVITSSTATLGQRLSRAEKDTADVHDALVLLRKNYDPRLKTVESDTSGLVTKVSTLTSTITNLGNTVLQTTIKATGNKISLDVVKKETADLTNNMTRIQSDLSGQASEIANLKKDVISLKSAVPGSSLTAMNNLVNKIVANPGSVQPVDIAQLKQALDAVQKALSNLVTPTPPSG